MKNPIDRFFSKVDRSLGGDACHQWRGATRHGYGQFWNGSKPVIAHRFIWEHVNELTAVIITALKGATK